MKPIKTKCPECGEVYEELTEEAANDPDRCCIPCYIDSMFERLNRCGRAKCTTEFCEDEDMNRRADQEVQSND